MENTGGCDNKVDIKWYFTKGLKIYVRYEMKMVISLIEMQVKI